MHSSFRVFHSPNTPLADPFRFYKPLPQANQTSQRRSPGNTNGNPEPKSKHLDNQPGRGTEEERGCHPRIREGERTANESDCAFPGERRCDELHQTVPNTESDIECTVMHVIRPSAVEGNSPENAVVIDDETAESDSNSSKEGHRTKVSDNLPEGESLNFTGSFSGSCSEKDLVYAAHSTGKVQMADNVFSVVHNGDTEVFDADGDTRFDCSIERSTQYLDGTLSKTTGWTQSLLHNLKCNGQREIDQPFILPSQQWQGGSPSTQAQRGHEDSSYGDDDADRPCRATSTHKRELSQTAEEGICKRRNRILTKTSSTHFASTRANESCGSERHDYNHVCHSHATDLAASFPMEVGSTTREMVSPKPDPFDFISDQSIDLDDKRDEALSSPSDHEDASTPSWQAQGTPVNKDDEDEYEVKDILDSRLFGRRLQYRVKWVGYQDDPEWYDAQNFENSPYKLRDFHEANPARPGPPKRLKHWIQRWDEQ